MAAESFDHYKMCAPRIFFFLKTFLRNFDVRTMPKLVVFFVFAGTEFFKSLSFS